MNKVRFDGKNWLARTFPNEEPRIKSPKGIDNFDFVTQKTREGLGPKGIVAIINSRGENDPNGAEFRYEWLMNEGTKRNKIQEIQNGSAFYVPEQDVYFVKGQEVHVREHVSENLVATFLFYNLPFEKNINSKHPYDAIEEAKKYNSIIGLSKIQHRDLFVYPAKYLKESLDFVVVHQGTDWGYSREKEIRIYDSLKDKAGALSIGGAYDIAIKNKRPFVGRCYAEFLAYPPKDHAGFFDYLEDNIIISNPSDLHSELLPKTEGAIKLVRSIGDQLKGWKRTIWAD